MSVQTLSEFAFFGDGAFMHGLTAMAKLLEGCDKKKATQIRWNK